MGVCTPSSEVLESAENIIEEETLRAVATGTVQIIAGIVPIDQHV